MEPPRPAGKGRERAYGVLFQLAKLASSGAELPELLRFLAKAAAELVGAQACSAMLLDSARRELLLEASVGLAGAGDEAIRFKLGEGIAGWVAERGAAVRLDDAAQDPRFKALPGQGASIHSLLCVPLLSAQGVIGTLTATDPAKGRFGEAVQELLACLAEGAAREIESARMYRLSIVDPLTKAFSRQYLSQRLPEEMERSRRYGDALSIALIQVEGLGESAGAQGPTAAELVLKQIVRLAQEQVREVDAIARYGADQLLVILPRTDAAGAQGIAQRIKEAVVSAGFPELDPRPRVSLSMGLATMAGGTATDEAFVGQALDALGRARGEGPGSIVVYDRRTRSS